LPSGTENFVEHGLLESVVSRSLLNAVDGPAQRTHGAELIRDARWRGINHQILRRGKAPY
jgi:hypothetical protein